MTYAKILAVVLSLGGVAGGVIISEDRLNQSDELLAMSEIHKSDFKAASVRMQNSENRAIKKEIRQLKKESRVIQAKEIKTEQERLMLLELRDEIQAAHIELKEAVK